MEIITGLRGNDQLYLEGYVYSKKRTGNSSVLWQCAYRGRFTCIGSLSTTNGPPYLNVSKQRPHSHPSNGNYVAATKMRKDLRKASEKLDVAPCVLLADALHKAKDEEKAILGKIATMKRDIRKQRQLSLPPVPRKVEDLEIGDKWRVTGGKDSKQFLIHDSGPKSIRALVFGTDDFVKLLGESRMWFMDGTFSISSKLFHQLYIIRGVRDNVVFTCVYIFMTRKTQQLYTEAFGAVLRKMLDLGVMARPEKIMMDFEDGAMRAAKTIFRDDVEIKGCFFHLSQCIWRHIQQAGLARLYKENDGVKLYCGMLNALAFLPPEDVEQGMLLLWATAPVELTDLLLYFETTYVSGRPGSDVPPQFQPKIWSVFNLVIHDLDKTNNTCEAWNRRFKALLGHTNASFWAVMTAVQRDESYERTKLLLSPEDALETNRKKKNESLKKFLKTKCVQYKQRNIEIEYFLKQIGKRMRF